MSYSFTLGNDLRLSQKDTYYSRSADTFQHSSKIVSVKTSSSTTRTFRKFVLDTELVEHHGDVARLAWRDFALDCESTYNYSIQRSTEIRLSRMRIVDDDKCCIRIARVLFPKCSIRYVGSTLRILSGILSSPSFGAKSSSSFSDVVESGGHSSEDSPILEVGRDRVGCGAEAGEGGI